MSEWIAQGNRPKNPNFKGELTERQQFLVDGTEAQERLRTYLSEACRTCMWVGYDVINPAAYKVAMGEMEKDDAIRKVVNETRECTGPEVDERYHDGDDICPVHERLNPRKGSCF